MKVSARRWHRRRHEILLMVSRRVAFLVPLLLLVTLGIFALATVSPYDPLDAYLGGLAGGMTHAQQASLAATLHLDMPWYAAWWEWIKGIFSGDPGTSRAYQQPVMQVMHQRLPWTLLLGLTGLFISVFLAFLLGVRAGLHPNGWVDRAISVLATILQTIPPFVLALAALSIFALYLNWLPTGGLTWPGQETTLTSTIVHLILPGIVLGITQLPWLILSLRESILDVLASDAIRGARVRGIPYSRIISHHVIPTALPPFIALVGSRLPELVAGSVLVEAIFAWPGLGSALVRSAQSLDFPLLTFLTVAITVLVLAGNLLSDVLFVILDPRVDADA